MNLTQAIAKLLWPREMLELIDKHRADGTLNDKAVKFLERKNLILLGVWLAIASVFAFTSEYLAGLIVLCLMPLGILADMRHMFKNNVLPYLKGKKIKVRILKIVFYYPSMQKIFSENIDDSTMKIVFYLKLNSLLPPEDKKLPNDIMDAYVYSQAGKYVGMPDISSIKEKYSLILTK